MNFPADWDEHCMELSHSLSGEISVGLAKEILVFLRRMNQRDVRGQSLRDFVGLVDQACEMVIEMDRDERAYNDHIMALAMTGMPRNY